MQSEEEKKAIERIKQEIDRYKAIETPKEVYITDIKILLSLIKKQQKEIEEWQKAYIRENNYWDKFRNKINKIANDDKDCSDNAVIKAVKELKEKNASLQKEIKLMKSININDNYIHKDKIREHKKELEEDYKKIDKKLEEVNENETYSYIEKQYVIYKEIKFLEELLEE